MVAKPCHQGQPNHTSDRKVQFLCRKTHLCDEQEWQVHPKRDDPFTCEVPSAATLKRH
jgi:hypothetical protein